MREQCLVSGLKTPPDSTRHITKYIRSFYCKVYGPKLVFKTRYQEKKLQKIFKEGKAVKNFFFLKTIFATADIWIQGISVLIFIN